MQRPATGLHVATPMLSPTCHRPCEWFAGEHESRSSGAFDVLVLRLRAPGRGSGLFAGQTDLDEE
jgi:hypothetical protein